MTGHNLTTAPNGEAFWVVRTWRRLEDRSSQAWASRIGKEAGRLRGRCDLIMFTAYLVAYVYVPTYLVSLATNTAALEVVAWILFAGGNALAFSSLWVGRQARMALASFLGRPYREVRHAPIRRMDRFDRWCARRGFVASDDDPPA